MNRLLLCLFLAFTFDIVMSQFYLTTCARMDVPFLREAATVLCVASCRFQNCGTGICEKRNGRNTCICCRCANGGNVPLEDLVEGRGGK
ncbi:unnamed protein product [Haemonchus placei]|uniref:Uncharacterized protein n=1 Tax=Haemonchus placei TaxID=6290 RepID=A0A0N4W8U7_HAEPC|nr:unnamed protein product [Haemonchus placei]